MTDSTVLDVEQIKLLLPHRPPMLFVEKLADIVPNESATGYKAVSINEPFFMGHFPNRAVMPGVLIVEAMAQLSGILAFKTKHRTPADGSIYYLGGTDHVRFKRPVEPGDRLDMESKIIADKRHVMKFGCNAYVDGELACSAEMICVEKAL